MIWQPHPHFLFNPNSPSSLWPHPLNPSHPRLSAFPASLLTLKSAKHLCTWCSLCLEHTSPGYLPGLFSRIFKSLFQCHLHREVSPDHLYKIAPFLWYSLSLLMLLSFSWHLLFIYSSLLIKYKLPEYRGLVCFGLPWRPHHIHSINTF